MRSSLFKIYFCSIVMLSAFAFAFTFPLLRYGVPSFDKNWFSNDFIIPYIAARITISKNRQLIYDRALQLDALNEIAAPYKFSKQDFCFEYPPYAFLFVAPLALMPFHVAYRVFQLVTWIFGGFIFIRYFCRPLYWNFWQSLLLVICATVSYPGVFGIVIGQYCWIFFGLFSLFYIGILQGSQSAAGISLALSSVKLQCVPIHLLIALVLGYKRLIIVFALVLLLMLLVTWYVFGLATILDFPKVLSNAETSKEIVGAFPEYQICVKGLFLRCFGEGVAAYLASFLYLLTLLGVAWIWTKTKNAALFVKQWALALTIMLQLVFALHVHNYDCLYIAFTVPLTLSEESKKVMLSTKTSNLAYFCWTATLFAYPFLSWIQARLNPHINGNIFLTALNIILLTACAICSMRVLSSRQEQAVGLITPNPDL